MAGLQRGMTVVTTVSADKLQSLQSLLAEIGRHPGGNAHVPFRRLTRVHFARFVILPVTKDPSGHEFPPQLVFATDYDAPFADHLEELVRVAGEGLRRIYAHCELGDRAHIETRGGLAAFLRAHHVDHETYYAGVRGRPVARILAEARLRDLLEEFLDLEHGSLGDDPGRILRKMRGMVRSNARLDWALSPPPSLTARDHLTIHADVLRHLLTRILLGAGRTATRALLDRLAGRGQPPPARASHDPAAIEARGREIAARLQASENRFVQNQMTHLVNIKPGAWNRFMLGVVLAVSNLRTHIVYTKGSINEIRSIVFARWVIIDGGRRLLFMSNYTGDWESYLGEFIDHLAPRINQIWDKTEAFPGRSETGRTGAANERAFKAWTRAHQLPAQVWYSAYPHLTLENILNNSVIRQGLISRMSPAEEGRWLQRL